MRRTPIKQKGETATLWDYFRAKYAEECRGDDGLIECQCDDNCGIRAESLDLHHDRGRAGTLLIDKRYLRWLIRPHHNKLHETPKGKEVIWDKLHSKKASA